MFVTAYHIENGDQSMYEVDARTAALAHPKEWSLTPWSDEAKDAWAKAKEAQAKADGLAKQALAEGKAVDGGDLPAVLGKK